MGERDHREEHLRQLDNERSRSLDPADIDTLRNALMQAAAEPSSTATVRARHRLMHTLAAMPQDQPAWSGFRSVLPRSVVASVAAIIVSGSALTAYAATGGPNVPAILLGAIGIESPSNAGDGRGRSEEAREEHAPSEQRPNVTGTANASERSAIGQEHRSDRANEVHATATVTSTPRPAGIGGSNASESGREHANPAATQGGERGEVNREARGRSGDTPAAEHRAAPQGEASGSDLINPELPEAAQQGQERAGLGSENREVGPPPGRGRP